MTDNVHPLIGATELEQLERKYTERIRYLLGELTAMLQEANQHGIDFQFSVGGDSTTGRRTYTLAIVRKLV